MDELNTKIKSIKTEKTLKVRPENIKSGVNIFGINGSVTELNGETATVTPTTSSQTITPTGTGKNALTSVTVNAVTSSIDNNITAGNIKNGVTILGVQGDYSGIDTSDANATAENIIEGKTAYVNGQKITGTYKPYKELEYIQATGAQFIKTNYVPNNNTSYEVDFEITGKSSGYEGLFGFSNYGETVDTRYTILNDYNYQNQIRIRVKGINDDNSYNLPATFGQVHNLKVEKNGSYNIDGTTGQIDTFEANNTAPIYIFAIRGANGNGNNPATTIRLYKLKFYDNNVLVHDFVPAKDISGVACLYDKVEAKFYYNAGTGDFSYPYDELKYIESTGTQYINTNYNPYKTKLEIKYQKSIVNREVGYITSVWNSNDNRYMPLAYINDGVNSNFTSRDRFATGYVLGNADTNEHILIYNDENNKVIFDNVEKATISDLTTQTDRPIYLFASNGSSGISDKVSVRIMYVKIWNKDTDTLERDFIPVQRTSDSVVCLYDKVGRTFYTNSGSGTFIAGI